MFFSEGFLIPALDPRHVSEVTAGALRDLKLRQTACRTQLSKVKAECDLVGVHLTQTLTRPRL